MNDKSNNNCVYLFGTCLIDQLYPATGLATIALLEQMGAKVIFPKNQSCCAQSAYNSGFRNEAREVARAQLDCFLEEYPIIVPSASCAGMMKHHWPKLFINDKDEKRVRQIAARVYELTEYLATQSDFIPIDKGEPVTVAIHNSCSALREMGVADNLKTLISHLKNTKIKEHEYKTECCGFGGTFAIKQADISGTMATDKARALADTGADKVISQDSSCLMNISGIYDKQGKGPKCQHIADFLLERIND